MLRDSFGRNIKDLRISVTDRCNFKCFYCKSARGLNYVERDEILSYEEIERLSTIFVELGIRKIRLTGGEPMLRKNLDGLVRRLSKIPQLEDIALTTNGFDFHRKAQLFKDAGLSRVTISLDSLRENRFQDITQSRDFENVIRSIEAAKAVGLNPVKVNCVVVRGVNEDEIPEFVDFARKLDITIRFIEFMPLDEDERWTRESVVTGAEIIDLIRARYQLVPLGLLHSSDTARHYDFVDGRGRVGLIMPVSRPFCGECSRIRLTADGKIRTCLFSMSEHDVKHLLRSGADDDGIRAFIRGVALQKEPGHRINEADFKPPSRSMSYIGG